MSLYTHFQHCWESVTETMCDFFPIYLIFFLWVQTCGKDRLVKEVEEHVKITTNDGA